MRWSLATRIGISYGIALTALLGVLAVTLVAFEATRYAAASVHDNYIPSVDMARRLLVRLERMENAEFMYFASTQEPRVWMGRFDDDAAAFEKWYQAAESVAVEPKERASYAQMGHHFGAFKHIDGRMRVLIAAGKAAEAGRLNDTESLAAAASIRVTAQAFYDFNLAESARARTTTDRMLRITEGLALAFALVGLLLASLAWRRASKDLVEPVQALHQAAVAVAAGRFVEASHPAAERSVELAGLQEAFNRMSSQLRDLTTRLQASNTTLEAQVAERTQALRDANGQLDQLVQELRALDKLKSDFLAVVSHELLTPINFITGFGSALEDGLVGPLTEEQLASVGKILKGAERLTRMVRNTLQYTQLEAGKIVLTPEEVDLAALVQDAVEAYRAPMAAKRLHVELQVPEDVPGVWGDPERMDQVFRELLDNAVKFTPGGGRIRLAVAVRPDWVVTEVADTGVGIPENLVAEVFKPFFQADLTSTRAYGGLGLGLAIAQQLVASMGGMLLVSSRPGRGTSLQVSLPRADQRPNPQTARELGSGAQPGHP